MSASSYAWLFQSVFYSWDHQRSLLQRVVGPYLSACRANGMTGQHLVYISNEQGQHLRLALACDADTKEVFLNDMHARIEDHIRENPSAHSGAGYQGKDLFMSFPNNSIHYNLFAINTAPGDALLDLGTGVSGLLVEFFSAADISDKNLRVFLICSFMSLCSVWKKIYGNLEVILNETISEAKKNSGEYTPAYFSDFDRLFDENKDQLVGIYGLAFSDNSYAMPVITALKQLFFEQLTGNAAYFPPDRSSFDGINNTLLKQVNLRPANLAGICHNMVRTIAEISELTTTIQNNENITLHRLQEQEISSDRHPYQKYGGQQRSPGT